MRKAADAIDKRFCFDIIPEDRLANLLPWIFVFCTQNIYFPLYLFVIGQAGGGVHDAGPVGGGQDALDGGARRHRAHVGDRTGHAE